MRRHTWGDLPLGWEIPSAASSCGRVAMLIDAKVQPKDLADLEGSAGAFADLVQFILKGVDLPFHLLEGCAFRGHEQAAILASGVAQEGNLHTRWVVGSAGPEASATPGPLVQLRCAFVEPFCGLVQESHLIIQIEPIGYEPSKLN